MKKYVINVFIEKDNKNDRRNFILSSDSSEESVIKPLILEKIKINSEEWDLEKDRFELVTKENVIIYECKFTKK